MRLNKTLELLDTPGILWPRFEDQQVGLKLALIGSINDQILNKDELACELIRFLKKRYPQVLAERFGLETEGKEAAVILEEIARVWMCPGRQPCFWMISGQASWGGSRWRSRRIKRTRWNDNGCKGTKGRKAGAGDGPSGGHGGI